LDQDEEGSTAAQESDSSADEKDEVLPLKPPAKPFHKDLNKKKSSERAVRLRRLTSDQPDQDPPARSEATAPALTLHPATDNDEEIFEAAEPTIFHRRCLRRGPIHEDGFDVIGSQDAVVVIDSAADQALAAIGANGKWRVLSTTGRQVVMTGLWRVG
jgi:hypothetical protein